MAQPRLVIADPPQIAVPEQGAWSARVPLCSRRARSTPSTNVATIVMTREHEPLADDLNEGASGIRLGRRDAPLDELRDMALHRLGNGARPT